ncbi:unnamed protein product [Leptidea sinapis]|uniref:Uncharacterized protein n=1 Tax=Leptidea sinapis TaxID=189913 RepID=A0A5E4R506_9NEOP|nr:unnamed protein product [Leptidea sinapis]
MSFQYVRIYYGPCDSFHSAIHKPQKLRGLREKLQVLGFRVDLIPIFRCNIKNLCFNMSSEMDPVCRRAVAAVLDSSSKLLRARNYLWFLALLDDQMFRRTTHALKDYWPFDYDDDFNIKKVY